MLSALVYGDPPEGQNPMAATHVVAAYLLELIALVGDDPAAVAAGAIAWVLMLLIQLAER